MKKIALILALIVACVALSSCGVVIEMLDSMLEHPHEYVYSLEPGEDDGTFDIVGRCDYQYCENPTRVEKNVQVYVSSITIGNCLEAGSTVYSCDFEGKTYTYTMQTSTPGHRLCGLTIDKFYINGNMVDSSVPGITLANESAKCGSTAEASYLCEMCGEAQNVLAYVSHKGAWTLKSAPTCTADGKEEIAKCERCQLRVERLVPAYGHNYVERVENNADGSANIIYDCTVKGCSFAEQRISNVQGVSEVTRVEPTCTEAGRVVYSYTKDGVLETVALTKRPLEHTIGGIAASGVLNSDGTIDYGLTGVTVVNKAQIVCGNRTAGYYCCESCDTPVPTMVYIRPHTMEPAEKWTVISPTCQNRGTVTKECEYCTYQVTEFTSDGSLDQYHNILITSVSFDSRNIYATLTSGRCQNAGCDIYFTNASMDAGSYNCTNIKATCKEAGEITHNWTVNGVAVQYKTTDLKTDHMIKDKDGNVVPAWTLADENGYYDYALDAINLFAGGSISCGQTAAANYRCVVCDGVNAVTAIQHHKMVETATIAAGCTTNGYTLFKCALCGVQDSTTIPAGHSIGYEHNLENNTLTQKCTKNSGDCNYTPTVIDLSTGTLAIKRTIKASTCCEYGKAEYVFKHTTATGEKTITFVGQLGLSSHTIKDNSGKIVNAETLCDENGHYDSSLDSIKYFAGGSAPALGCTSTGYFLCESCGEPAMITVINKGND